MTPSFALLLSPDGIVLLHRSENGWLRLGTADVGAEDLGAEMAALRALAQATETGDLGTKLILPDEQIRYLTIETAQTTQDEVEAAVLAATPLARDEMRIDFDRFGGRTHIAAVAEQTLSEAESFAQEHGFTPLCFSALAEPYTFQQEVFFGAATGAAAAAEVPPEKADGLRAALRAPMPPQTDADADIPVFVSRPRDADTPSAQEEAPVARFTRHSGAADDGAVAPTLPGPAKPRPSLSAQRSPSRTETTADIALSRGLTSDTSNRRSPVAGVALAAGLAVAVIGAGVWASRSIEGDLGELLTLDPGLQEDPLANAPVEVAVVAPPTMPEVAPSVVAQPVIDAPADDTPPTPIVTAIPGRVLSPSDAARIYAATGVWQRAPRLPADQNVDEQSTLAGLHAFANQPTADRLPVPTGPAPALAMHELQVIAPRNPAPVNRPLPRDADGFIRASRTGTIMPTGVPVFARAPAARPPLRPTDDRVYLRDDSVPAVLIDGVTGIALMSFTAESAAPTARAFIAPILRQPDPVIAPKFVQPPAPSTDIAAATTPADPLPVELGPAVMSQLADLLADPTPEALVGRSFRAVSTADTPLNQQAPLAVNAGLADLPFADQSSATADAPDGFVEVIFGRPAIVPPLRPGTPEIAPQVATSAPTTADTLTEAVDVALQAPAPATTPPLPQDLTLAGFRPSLRPAGLVPASRLTYEAIPALAGARPTLRPAGLVPEPEPEPEQIATPVASSDISAIVAAIAEAAPPSQIVAPTAQAIALSPRPDARPRNFDRVVANARALTQRQQQRDTAAATSVAVIQTPQAQTAPVTGGSTGVAVARAATVDNAIRLRDMNLIGVYGKPGARRALVRMPNGRFVKVEVGSSLDGGRVTAIGDTALNFVKRGQTYALQLPAG